MMDEVATIHLREEGTNPLRGPNLSMVSSGKIWALFPTINFGFSTKDILVGPGVNPKAICLIGTSDATGTLLDCFGCLWWLPMNLCGRHVCLYVRHGGVVT